MTTRRTNADLDVRTRPLLPGRRPAGTLDPVRSSATVGRGDPSSPAAPARTGMVLAVVSVAACATSGTLAKVLFAAGWSPGAAILIRMAGGALVLAVPALLALRGRRSVLRDNVGLLTTFGVVAVACSQLFYFQAVSRLSVGVALLVEYLAPVVVVGWAWATTRRRPSGLTLAGSAVAVAGLVQMVDLGGDVAVDPVGVAWGLAAAACLAAYFVLSARQAPGLPPIVLVAVGMVVGTVTLATAWAVGLMAVTAPFGPVPIGDAEVSWLVPAIGLAVVPGALGYATGVAASRRLGARVTAFVSLSEVAFALAIAWLVLGEVPALVQWVGGAVLLAGIMTVRIDEFRTRCRSAGQATTADA